MPGVNAQSDLVLALRTGEMLWFLPGWGHEVNKNAKKYRGCGNMV
eukprot:COSAG02_NODE_718_length_18064_cov_5.507932_12_plen_45_part_00